MKTIIYAIIFTLITVSAALCQDEAVKKKPNVLVSRVIVRVLDKETFKPVDAKILITSQNPDNQIAPIFEDQAYRYKIAAKDTTTFSIYAPGYEPLNASIVANDFNGTEVFYLTPKADERDRLANARDEYTKPILQDEITSILYFSQSNTDMANRSKQELELLLEFLRRNEYFKIELAGHTDNVGDEDKNMMLSVDRASVIRQYLLANSVSPNRIKSRAFGCTKPVAPNDTERNRKFNRRVEVRIAQGY
ncbi:OmpA family protein [Dyadobacter sp. CY312]|uniref:OmpA family protein n=1 Tax=Dyadobacter sp. CY312 TaxID=2907303 RepID=UPI001F33A861|nr:OmpA family protein [Dyadobacter sp. CY312]MCE7040361.1 OmpA family protein [Dyadobacter sp. CY312]